MGTFHTKCKIENPTNRIRSLVIPKLLVDTGSEYTWVSERSLERIGISREKKDVAFILANGQEVIRSVGFAIIRLDKFFTIDEVVFAEPGDLSTDRSPNARRTKLDRRASEAKACRRRPFTRRFADMPKDQITTATN